LYKRKDVRLIMFKQNSKTYKFIPGVQIVDEVFEMGYVVEELNPSGFLVGQYFTTLTKPKIIDRIKDANEFKTHTEQIIDQLLEEID